VLASGERIHAEGIILATTADVARRLHDDASPAEREVMRAPSVPGLSIAVALNRDLRNHPALRDSYAVLTPAGERIDGVCGVSFESGRIVVPRGQETLHVHYIEDAAGKRLALPDAEILDRMFRELEQLFGEDLRACATTEIFRHPTALHAAEPGRSEAVDAYVKFIDGQWQTDSKHSTGTPRIYLAGDYLDFDTVEGAMFSGDRAAEWALRSIGDGSPRAGEIRRSSVCVAPAADPRTTRPAAGTSSKVTKHPRPLKR
jgi:hypothetical protein